jgi:TPR repeat protein
MTNAKEEYNIDEHYYEKYVVKTSEYYENSAKKDYNDVRNEINENGTDTNLDWYQETAESGNKFSQYYLGKYYEYVKKDKFKAFEWYKKSAEQEYSDAQSKLGYFYESGIGTVKDLKKAIYWYQKAAENGNKISQHNLGVFYHYGNGIEKDEVKAFEWYKKSAEQEYGDAQNQLGYSYEKGIGTVKDLKKAIYWYQKAAGRGNKFSQYNLGVCYQYGKGVEKNEVNAFKLYKKSAEQEYCHAQYQLGYFYKIGIGTEKNLKKAIYWYQKAAENGNKFSLYKLGNYYKNGKGVEKDEVKAFKLYKKSAKQEFGHAQNNIGYFYKNGIGTEQDIGKAIYWYQKAAKNGNKYSQYNLGICYEYGNGIEKDEVKAFEWYKKSAEQEFSNAQNNLGYLYRNGIGTEQDLEKANYWYQKAAENGNKISQYNLGIFYQYGNGVVKDEIKAFEWFKKSAEQKYSDAQNQLGYFYKNGIGTKKDLGKAIYWYQKAAENGNKFSQYNLGICYEYGNGVKKNEVKAFKWYIKSAGQGSKNSSENGDPDGIFKLACCYYNGIGTSIDKQKALILYKKAENLKKNTINFPTKRVVIKSMKAIRNDRQMIRQLKLNHGLLFDGYNLQPSRQAIFTNNGELNVSLYSGQPIIYSNINDSISSEKFFIDKDNFNNTLLSSDVCINFPIAEITYRGDLLESFSKCTDNNENLYRLYGHFFASSTLIGGKLVIKNLNSATQAQIDVLKFCLFCAYNSAKYSINIPVNNLFTLNLLPKIVTLDGEELNTHEKLVKWVNNLYQEGEKSIFTISYDNFIPVSQLRNNIVSPVDDLFNENQPGISNFKEKLSLEEWVGDAVNNNLASWTRDFHLFQGIIFDKDYEMEISKKIAITFTKIPKINPSDLSYLKITKPSTNIEAFLISNNIYSTYNLKSFPFIIDNSISGKHTKGYENCTHILIKCEQYEIILNKDNIKPTQEFEYAIDEALNSMKPLRALQDIFNEYGHLFPQRIVLGRSLKNILSTSFTSETIDIRSESLKPHLDKLNISFFLTPKGKIIEKNDLPNWLQNPNNLEIIEFDNIDPLYKILKEEQQMKINDLLQNNYKILMTGITDLKDLDNNDVEYYKRINIEPSLEDEDYEVYGSIISKDNSKLGVYVNFGSYDSNGFFAMIKKLEETRIVITECNVLWMIVEKPSKLLVFSPSNREFQIECIKESIILQSDKSNYYITPSFPLFQGYTIFVHAYCPSSNYEPDNIINLVKWSHNSINFQITKSVYNELNNNFPTDIEEDISLDLYICVLCSDFKKLKFDINRSEEGCSLDLTGYVLTKNNFNENLLTENQ